MERMLFIYLKKGQFVSRFKHDAEQVYIVITGKLGEYKNVAHNRIDGHTPDSIYEPYMTWGEDAMTEELKWDGTVMALKKSLVLSLHKKDLIEVLSHVKVVQQSNKQSFLLKSQFLNELSYNRVLEFNDLLQRSPKRVQAAPFEKGRNACLRVARSIRARQTITGDVVFSPLHKGKILILMEKKSAACRRECSWSEFSPTGVSCMSETSG